MIYVIAVRTSFEKPIFFFKVWGLLDGGFSFSIVFRFVGI